MKFDSSINLGCELLQNVYLCISTYNVARKHSLPPWGCELLQNVYLCISTYNCGVDRTRSIRVVNCFKMCIFALARTTQSRLIVVSTRCELLQNVYLCISTYNPTTGETYIEGCELLQNVYLCISTYNYLLV